MLVPIPFVLSMGHLLRGGKRALAAFCTVYGQHDFPFRSRGGMLVRFEMVLFAALLRQEAKSLAERWDQWRCASLFWPCWFS